MNVITEMKNDIQAHNKFLTNEYLDKLPVIGLLRLTHPLYRSYFAKKALEQWKIRREAAMEFISLY